MKSTYSKIQIIDFNSIQSQAAETLGTGVGPRGYGQSVNSVTATTGSKVSLTNISALRTDILNIAAHQQVAIPALLPVDLVGTDAAKLNITNKIKAGIVSFTGSISGTTLTVTANNTNLSTGHIISGTGITDNTVLVKALTGAGTATGTWQVSASQTVTSGTITAEHPFDQYYRVMTALYNTPFYIDTAKTKSFKVSKSGTWASVIGGTSWSSKVTGTATVTFATSEDARHFFNSGGKLKFSSTHTGDRATTQNASWTTLLNANTGVLYGGNVPSTGVGGSDGLNYFRLTNSPKLWKTVSPSTTYTSNFWRIYAQCEKLDNSTGSAKTITFTFEWKCDYAGSPTDTVQSDDTVGGTLTIDVETLEPDSILLPSSTKFSIPSPTIVVLEFESWSVFQSRNSVNEGTINADGVAGAVTFTINTSNNAPTAKWATSFPQTNAAALADFVNVSSNTTPAVFTGGSSTLTRNILGDFITEGTQKFQMAVTDSNNLVIVGPMTLISILDTYPAYTPTLVGIPSGTSVNTAVVWYVSGAWPYDSFNYTVTQKDPAGIATTQSFVDQTIVSTGANMGKSTNQNYTYTNSLAGSVTTVTVTFSTLPLQTGVNPIIYTTGWRLPKPTIAFDPNKPKTVDSVSITFTCSTAKNFSMYKKGPTDNTAQLMSTITVNDGGTYTFVNLGAGVSYDFSVTAGTGGANNVQSDFSDVITTVTVYNPIISYVSTGTALTNNSWSIAGGQPSTSWLATGYATLVGGAASGTITSGGLVQNGVTYSTWEGVKTTTFTFGGDNTITSKTMVITWAPPPMLYYVSDSASVSTLTTTITGSTAINVATTRSIYIKVTQGYGTITVRTNSKTPSSQTLSITDSSLHSDGGGTTQVTTSYNLSVQGTTDVTITLSTTPSEIASGQTSSFYISSTANSATYSPGFSVTGKPLVPFPVGTVSGQTVTVKITAPTAGYVFEVYVQNRRLIDGFSQNSINVTIDGDNTDSATFTPGWGTIQIWAIRKKIISLTEAIWSDEGYGGDVTVYQIPSAPVIRITNQSNSSLTFIVDTNSTAGAPTSYKYSATKNQGTTTPSTAFDFGVYNAINGLTANSTWFISAIAINSGGTSTVGTASTLTLPDPPTVTIANTSPQTNNGGWTATITSPDGLKEFIYGANAGSGPPAQTDPATSSTYTSGTAAMAVSVDNAAYSGKYIIVTASVKNATGYGPVGKSAAFISLPAIPVITWVNFDDQNSPGAQFKLNPSGGLAASLQYQINKGSAPASGATWSTLAADTLYTAISGGTVGDTWYVNAKATNSASASSNILQSSHALIAATPPSTPTFTYTDSSSNQSFGVNVASTNATSITWQYTPVIAGSSSTGTITGASGQFTIPATTAGTLYSVSAVGIRYGASSTPGTGSYNAPIQPPTYTAAISGNTITVTGTLASGSGTATLQYALSTSAYSTSYSTTNTITISGTGTLYIRVRAAIGTQYSSVVQGTKTVSATPTTVTTSSFTAGYGATVTISATGGGGGGGGGDQGQVGPPSTGATGGTGGSGATLSVTITLPSTHNRLQALVGGGGAGGGTSYSSGGGGTAGSGGNWGGGAGGGAGSASGGGGGGGSETAIRIVDSAGVNTLYTGVVVGGGGGGGGASAKFAGGTGTSASTSVTTSSSFGLGVGSTYTNGTTGTLGGGGGGGGGGMPASNSNAAAGVDNVSASSGGGGGGVYIHSSLGASSASAGLANNGAAGAPATSTAGTSAAAGGSGSVSYTYTVYTLA